MHKTGFDLNIVLKGHSGVPRIGPQFFTLLEIPCEWKVHIYRSGSANIYRSIVEGGLIAGGPSDHSGRQAPVFSAMDPLEDPLRMVHYEHSKRPDLDAECAHLT